MAVWLPIGVGLGVVVVLLAVAHRLWCARPHLKNTPSGNLVARFAAEREVMLSQVTKEHGLTCELQGYLVTADPKLAKTLMLSKAHTAQRSRWYRASSYLLYGMDGVLNMDGDVWRRHTRALAVVFQPQHVARYMQLMHASAVRHARAWVAGVCAEDGVLPRAALDAAGPSKATVAGGGPAGVADSALTSALTGGGPDLLEAVRGVLMEVLMAWAYGLRLDSADAEEAGLARDLAAELASYGKIVGRMGQKPLQLVCSYAALVGCTQRLRALTGALVDWKRRQAGAGRGAGPKAPATSAGAAAGAAGPSPTAGSNAAGAAPVDAVQRMMDAGFSLNELAAEVNHIHGAHKAAGYVLTHLLHDLSQPRAAATAHSTQSGNGGGSSSSSAQSISEQSGQWWGEAVRREVLAVLGTDGVPTRDDVAGRLPLLRAIILEAQRKHVVSLGVVRRTGEALVIDGVAIPGGTEVVVLLQALHNSPHFWRAPHEFRPERWLARGELRAALVGSGFATAKAVAAVPATTGTDGGAGTSDAVIVGGVVVELNSPIVGSGLGNSPSALAGGSAASVAAATGDADGEEADGGAAVQAYSSRQGAAADASAEPYAFLPFLAGGRMCAGKFLAELELAVGAAALLRAVRVRTSVPYIGHVHGVPKAASAAAARRYVAAAGATLQVREGYAGPAELLLADNMYSSIDGPVPFDATAVGEATCAPL